MVICQIRLRIAPRGSVTSGRAESVSSASVTARQHSSTSIPEDPLLQKEAITILDDDTPRRSRRASSSVSLASSTVGYEPSDAGSQSSYAIDKFVKRENGGGSKRIKLDPDQVSKREDETTELLRLRREQEFEEEKLAAAKEVARLIKEKRARQARIAELEIQNTKKETEDLVID